jgi:molybdenum cofactor guanylyltransferase
VSARALTGVLLVGGASTRFGSPKALARAGGETLAERAWRVLADACEERIAVGKAGELELPFDVLDDGVDVRAPIAGVVAGLRAASHDVAVFLPVDCPLVLPALLRRLGEERAVPQTGPLPGAYGKDELAVLERRLAAGRLSLRGVNPRVLPVDAELLANVNTPAELSALEEHLTARDAKPA